MKNLSIILLAVVLLLTACQQTATPVSPATETAEVVMPSPEEEKSPTRIVPTPPQELHETSAPAAIFEPVVALEPLASGFTAPVALTAPADGSNRLFVVDQIGLIYIIDENDQLLEQPFLDVREKMVSLNPAYDERGLLGLAFHPDYAENGRFFVYYTAPLRPEAPSGWNSTNLLAEFRVSEADANRADPQSEKIILMVDKPQANHNAGSIVFGPDGYLYIPLGDGGGANDSDTGHVADWYDVNQGGNGQDVEQNLLGSILRIDIDGGEPYSIPEDNPDVSDAYPEIWAFGFRNPYRMAFDPGGEHLLFTGDAGQELWEEINLVEAGGNYGWNVREGAHCFSTAEPGNPDAITDCPEEDDSGNPLRPPIIELANSKHPDGGYGATIVGGVVYRGSLLPGWDGKYLFGMWSVNYQSPQGTVYAASIPTVDLTGLWDFVPIAFDGRENAELREYLLGFGQDADGEVYLLTTLTSGPSGTGGSVYRLTPVN